MAHLLDYLADRVLLCDGAWDPGTGAQPRIERDFHGHENCTEILCESRPDLVREIHLGYLEAGCRRGPDQQLWRLADHARRVRHRRQARSRSTAAPAELAREAVAEFAHDGRTRFVFGSVGPGTRLPIARPCRLSGPRRCAHGAMRRADRRRGRRDPDRDLPGPAADQGRGQRRQAGARGRAQDIADPRPGHGRDHRHAAGRRRHRRGGDDHPRARRADDRAQLRHRPARDGRACQMARRELAGADLGPAQCRPARAGRRPGPLPAGPQELAQWLERFVARGRRRHRSAAAAAPTTAQSPRSTRCCAGSARRRAPRPAPKPRSPVWAPSVASLYGQVALRQENA